MFHLPFLNKTSDLLYYTPAVASHLVKSLGGLEDASHVVAATYGYISKDSAVAVVSNGPNIDVISVKKYDRLAAWSFGSSSIDPVIEGTCIEPLEVDSACQYQNADYVVTNNTFQEPENDPRSYVYYWVLRGENPGRVGRHASATFYSLSYRHRRDMLDSPSYSGLETVMLRLAYDLLILTGHGMVAATHHGLQLANQTTTLVHPAQLFETSAKDLSTAGQQKVVLLSVALEHNMVFVIVVAARDWADERFSTAGCRIKFLLDWSWRRVAVTVPLFDCSVAEVDDKCRQLLMQLANFCSILAAVTSDTVVARIITRAIHWFISLGLLPEQMDGQARPIPAKQLLAQSPAATGNLEGGANT